MPRYDHVGTHATTVSNDGTHTVITYHSTDVVKFNNDETILNSGGYTSYTTKVRMNQASQVYGLGYWVYQKDFTWYVDIDGEENDILFEDGMSF